MTLPLLWLAATRDDGAHRSGLQLEGMGNLECSCTIDVQIELAVEFALLGFQSVLSPYRCMRQDPDIQLQLASGQSCCKASRRLAQHSNTPLLLRHFHSFLRDTFALLSFFMTCSCANRSISIVTSNAKSICVCQHCIAR